MNQNTIKDMFCRSMLLLFTIVSLSCENKPTDQVSAQAETREQISWRDHWEKPTQKAELLSNSKVHKRIKECLMDTSIVVLTSTLVDDLERYSKIKSLGDINNDGVYDSIIVIPELFIDEEGAIENGASAIFTNNEIPRIRVDVPCLEVDYFFPVDDINNDGLTELGKYYSSCASRFKGLELISLEQNEWKRKGQVTFDVFFDQPEKEKRIEKTGPNKFRMRKITSGYADSIIDTWETFEMK